jgi:hypothetical protein
MLLILLKDVIAYFKTLIADVDPIGSGKELRNLGTAFPAE